MTRDDPNNYFELDFTILNAIEKLALKELENDRNLLKSRIKK